MESIKNVVEIRPEIGQLTREELDGVISKMDGEEKIELSRQAKAQGVRKSDVLRDILKQFDPDQDKKGFSQGFLRRRMNNPSESIPRFCLGN